MPSIIEYVCCHYFDPLIPNLEDCECFFFNHPDFNILIQLKLGILTGVIVLKLNFETKYVELRSVLVVTLAAS